MPHSHIEQTLSGYLLTFLRTISTSLRTVLANLMVRFVNAANLLTLATDFPTKYCKFLEGLRFQRRQSHERLTIGRHLEGGLQAIRHRGIALRQQAVAMSDAGLRLLDAIQSGVNAPII